MTVPERSGRSFSRAVSPISVDYRWARTCESLAGGRYVEEHHEVNLWVHVGAGVHGLELTWKTSGLRLAPLLTEQHGIACHRDEKGADRVLDARPGLQEPGARIIVDALSLVLVTVRPAQRTRDQGRSPSRRHGACQGARPCQTASAARRRNILHGQRGQP